jgi:hypothetical protein
MDQTIKTFLTYSFLPHLPIYNQTLHQYPILPHFLNTTSISFPLPSLSLSYTKLAPTQVCFYPSLLLPKPVPALVIVRLGLASLYLGKSLPWPVST